MDGGFEKLTRPQVEALDVILGEPLRVLHDGFVPVIDYMGDDLAIVQAARVSYGAAVQTPADAWRLQSADNKQGSAGMLDAGRGEALTRQEREVHRLAREAHEHRPDLGVAGEQARKDLPLCTFTEACWRIDLHNLLRLRVTVLVVTPGYGGGTPRSLVVLATDTREAQVLAELRRRLEHVGTVDGVDVFRIPRRDMPGGTG